VSEQAAFGSGDSLRCRLRGGLRSFFLGDPYHRCEHENIRCGTVDEP
jgi:hypothetical protein